jgi:hypothetical protein
MVDDAMSAAWREAATQLGIQVIAPHRVPAADGTTVEVEAYLPYFGGTNGAIAVSLADHDRCRLTRGVTPFVSQLADKYRVFDSALFRETLNDWGWFGPPESRPPWYSGTPWS